MTLVVYAEASAGTYPGHMVVGEEQPNGDAQYFGFRFDPADLPEQFQAQKKWREYLLFHAVPGEIVDETEYVARLLISANGTYFEKRTDCDAAIASRLPPSES